MVVRLMVANKERVGVQGRILVSLVQILTQLGVVHAGARTRALPSTQRSLP